MGIVTVTLLTGFTFSMAVTGVQAAAEGEGTTTQETKANDVSSSSEQPAVSSSDEKDQLKNDQSSASNSSDTSISKASSTTSSSQSSSSEQSSGTSDASSIGSSSSSSAGASSQSNANKPATDVNGHSLKFDSSSNQKTADSSSETKTVNDKTATQTADVKKDADGNYWLPVVEAQADETTGVNTYTQLTDYSYTQNANSSTYTITGYTGELQKYLAGGTTPEAVSATDITLPTTYNGGAITAIADNAFAGIGISGEIVIPDTVTSIGKNAFADNQITGTVTIPNSVTSIGDDAFANNQITSVVLGNGTWFTGHGTFENNQISSLDLGTGVNTIGIDTFKNNLLTTLTLPAKIGQIDAGAFQDNKSLVTVNIDPVSQLTGIDSSAFESDSLTSLILPSSVVNIGNSAFANNQIKTLTLGTSVQTIGTSAFANNQISGSVDIPDKVTGIGDDAFANNQIKALTLGTSVQTIGTSAFTSNQISGSVDIPDKVTGIGDDAFANNQIKALTLGTAVKTIGTNAFTSNQISGSVDIPNTVTDIGDDAFANNQIETLTLGTGVQTIGINTFLNNKISGTVTIPDSVTELGAYAFMNNEISGVSLSDKITQINIYAFANNKLKDQLVIPDAVTNIGDSAFANNGITGLTLDNNLQTIGDDAFANNYISGKFTVLGSVYAIGENAFLNNQISELVLDKVNAGVNQTIATNAFAQNEISQVSNNSKNDSDDYLSDQKAKITVNLYATATQIENIRTAIEGAVHVTLPEVLTFTDKAGKQWQYDSQADTLTIPSGETMPTQVTFKFSSVGSASYGTNDLVINLDQEQTGPAVAATTTTIDYETPDGKIQGSAQLVGTPGTPFDRYKVQEYVPAGWQLADSVSELPLIIAQDTNRTVVIPLVIASSGPAVAATTTTVNYETPDGTVQGSAQLVGTPGTPFDRYKVQEYVPAGWQLADSVSELPLIIAQDTNQTVIIPLVAKTTASSGPAVAATTTTIDYETPDGKIQGSVQLVGTPGTPFDRYKVQEYVPAGWQLAVLVSELPLIIAQDTNQTVIIPLVTASSGPAVAATTTTIDYETPDSKIQGSAQLVGTPGTPFDRYQVQEYVPAGWQLAIPVSELPLIIAQDTNQTVIIPLVAKTTASSGPAVAATTTTVNYETPDGKIKGSAQLVGTPGTPFDRYQVQEYVPDGWQLAVSVSELPLIIAQGTNQTVVVPLAAQTGTETGPAVEATTTTVKYETPDGVTRGYITLIGEPGYSFGQDEIMAHKPADWQLAVPVDELPKLVSQTGNQTIVIPLAAQTKTEIGPVVEATTTTVDYETPDGTVQGSAQLIGTPGTPFDRYQVLAYVPAGWQLAIPISELPLIIAQATNQTVVIPLVAQDDTGTPPAQPAQPENGNGGGSTTTTGQSNGQVPTDPEQPNSSTDNGGAVTPHTRPSISTSDSQAGQVSAGEQSSLTAATGLHEDSNSGRAVEIERTVQTARLTTSKHQTGSSKAQLPQLPQTDETTPTQPTLIGGLLLSILGWFGLAHRKHEKD
ncbi:leucine-rich repeat domain-containing protein [Secundilactobacillus silagincola]|nr:leucine-rich repeat domain-containing protein [Secundilactobacillus silagincola]